MCRLGASLLILGTPNLFKVETIIGGVVWVFLIAAEEMFAPYIDYYSNQHNSFFYKELGVAVDGGICPLLITLNNNFITLGIFSLAMLTLSYLLLIAYSKKTKKVK